MGEEGSGVFRKLDVGIDVVEMRQVLFACISQDVMDAAEEAVAFDVGDFEAEVLGGDLRGWSRYSCQGEPMSAFPYQIMSLLSQPFRIQRAAIDHDFNTLIVE